MDKLDEIEGKKEKKTKLRGSALIEESLVEVTEENIHKYSLKDVVLPLVGYKVRFPKNEEMSVIIFDIMNKDGVNMQMFEQ